MKDQLPPRRELAGPYVILGIDKDADDATISMRLTQQQRALASGHLTWSADDLEWARAELSDPKRRLAADLNSLDVDLATGEIHRLARLYGVDEIAPGWEPMDPEPEVEVVATTNINMEEIAAAIPAPDVPLELPAINRWLDQFGQQVTDPWTIELAG